LKWDKNKGTKGYLLAVDDAGVVGVLRGNVRLLFIRVPIDGELDGAWMGDWTGAAADAPAATSKAATGAWTGAADDAPAATFEAATGSWTGAAADALAAMSEAPTMGISFFSIARVFSLGFFRCEVEKMMGQERRLQ
jgi:hypothetical protein